MSPGDTPPGGGGWGLLPVRSSIPSPPPPPLIIIMDSLYSLSISRGFIAKARRLHWLHWPMKPAFRGPAGGPVRGKQRSAQAAEGGSPPGEGGGGGGAAASLSTGSWPSSAGRSSGNSLARQRRT